MSYREREELRVMRIPLLIIINGLPGAGKTTLARRLGRDLGVPVFSRDGFFESLADSLECGGQGEQPALLGKAAYDLMYYVAGELLGVGQPVIVEGFFGRPELRSEEFLRLQRSYPFEPVQILCRAAGATLVERVAARVGGGDRHTSHPDLMWLEENRERLLQGELAPLTIGGRLVEVDTTEPDGFDYDKLLKIIKERSSGFD